MRNASSASSARRLLLRACGGKAFSSPSPSVPRFTFLGFVSVWVFSVFCVGTLGHIHVAPEYFQRCDGAGGGAGLQPTGAAWLLSQFGSDASAFCRGPWAELLGCLETEDGGAGHHEKAELELRPSREGNSELLSSLMEVERAALAAESVLLAREGTHPQRPRRGLSARGLSAPASADGKLSHRKRGTKGKEPARGQGDASVGDWTAADDRGGGGFEGLAVSEDSAERAERQPPVWQRFFPSLPQTVSQFLASVASSCSVVGATELGDRTFFLAALLASRYSRVVVFAAAAGALIAASFASTALGALLQASQERRSTEQKGLWALLQSFAVKYNVVGWTAALLLLAFGVFELFNAWKAFRRGRAGGSGDARERTLLAASLEASTAECSPAEGRSSAPSLNAATLPAEAVSPGQDALQPRTSLQTELPSPPGSSTSSSSESDSIEGEVVQVPTDSVWANWMAIREQRNKGREDALDRLPAERRRGLWEGQTEGAVEEALAEAQEDLHRLRALRISDLPISQYSRLGLHPSVLRVFREVFVLTLFAELGDKSMLATVSLAASRDPWGVLLGSCLAHVLVTLSAVFCGKLLQNWLSDRGLKLLAGGLMFGFGALAGVEAARSMQM